MKTITDKKRQGGALVKEIEALLEVQRMHYELLRWHIEHAKEVMEIENKNLR